ncbi:hypothetical protein BH09DEP1_BH09DEP1_2150 [soil metagenome]
MNKNLALLAFIHFLAASTVSSCMQQAQTLTKERLETIEAARVLSALQQCPVHIPRSALNRPIAPKPTLQVEPPLKPVIAKALKAKKAEAPRRKKSVPGQATLRRLIAKSKENQPKTLDSTPQATVLNNHLFTLFFANNN